MHVKHARDELRTTRAARIPQLARQLQTLGVPKSSRHETRYEKQWFGRYREVQVPLEPAWPVGRLEWRQRETSGQGDRDGYDTGVLPDGRLVVMTGGMSAMPSDLFTGLYSEHDYLLVARRLEELITRHGGEVTLE